MVERAERRRSEAEAGASSLRAQVANEIVASKQAAAEVVRVSREEALQLISDARAEADELRAQARTMLTDARTEVATLRTRRDEIARELTGLSGVIEALAVPTDGPTDIPDAPAAPTAVPMEYLEEEDQQ